MPASTGAPIPRFRFHLADGLRETDPELAHFPDAESAKMEAARFAGELLQSQPSALWAKGQWRVEVTDENNVLMWSVTVIAVDTPASADETPPA